jgi:hypothetical protein
LSMTMEPELRPLMSPARSGRRPPDNGDVFVVITARRNYGDRDLWNLERGVAKFWGPSMATYSGICIFILRRPLHFLSSAKLF